MTGFAESSTIQAAVADRLSNPDLGWTELLPNELEREDISVLIKPDVTAALLKLNPAISAAPDRVDQVLPALRLVKERARGRQRTDDELAPGPRDRALRRRAESVTGPARRLRRPARQQPDRL